MAGTKREILFDKGPKGKCEVRILKNKTIRIVAEDSLVYDIDPENSLAPVVVAGKDMFFRLNKNETHLYDLRPYGSETEATFIVQHKWIPHGEGKVPETFTKQGREVTWRAPDGGIRKWWDPEMEMFNVEMEIITGKYKGMTFKQALAYFFYEDEDGNMMMSGKGKPARMLEDYMTLSGFDWSVDTIPFSSNILPALDGLLQDRSRPFQVRVVKGWVKEMFTAPDLG